MLGFWNCKYYVFSTLRRTVMISEFDQNSGCFLNSLLYRNVLSIVPLLTRAQHFWWSRLYVLYNFTLLYIFFYHMYFFLLTDKNQECKCKDYLHIERLGVQWFLKNEPLLQTSVYLLILDKKKERLSWFWIDLISKQFRI